MKHKGNWRVKRVARFAGVSKIRRAATKKTKQMFSTITSLEQTGQRTGDVDVSVSFQTKIRTI